MRFYDAELLRLRARTESRDAARATLSEAIALARTQGAHIFELRATLDLAEVGEGGARPRLLEVVDRFPRGSRWPDLERARQLAT
jgi:hypothetical protein